MILSTIASNLFPLSSCNSMSKNTIASGEGKFTFTIPRQWCSSASAKERLSRTQSQTCLSYAEAATRMSVVCDDGRFIFPKECDSVACSWAKPKNALHLHQGRAIASRRGLTSFSSSRLGIAQTSLALLSLAASVHPLPALRYFKFLIYSQQSSLQGCRLCRLVFGQFLSLVLSLPLW